MRKKMISITAATIIFGCLFSVYAFTAAEKEEPQEIRGIIVDNHDSMWYERQQQLWLQRAKANPQDEHAWKEAFEAARYADMLTEQYGKTERKQSILNQMKENIPNSYTYNMCMYMTEISVPDGQPEEYAKEALRLMPEDTERKDTEVMIAYLWTTGKTFAMDRKPNEEQEYLHRFAERLYTSNAYPSYLLRYTYNSLQGIEDNGIYFVNGDVPGYTSLILQEAMGIHRDKIVVQVSFLYIDTYRSALCKRLGIKDFEITKDYSSMENWEDVYLEDILEHIISNSKREAYFFPHGSYPETESFMKNLYNEGLVFHYSTKRYDNMSVAKDNVEKRYYLQYLTEPGFVSEEQWKGSERIQLNYMVMLAPIVKSYRDEGDTVRANQLARYLSAAVMQTSLSQEDKQQYFNLMESKKR